MTPAEKQLELDPSEFAFYFESDTGIEAGDLGDFLKRTAIVARREGAEIRVVGFEQGSLIVVFKAIAKKAKSTATKVKKEFNKAPLGATASAATIIVPIVGAIVWAMSPDSAAPLAQASAEVMEKHEVTAIKLITINENITVMDEERAEQVREVVRHRKAMRAAQREMMIEDRREPRALLTHEPIHQKFEGSFAQLGGELHFRPDGYSYFVPVVFMKREEQEKVLPGGLADEGFYRVDAHLIFKQKMPDRMIILGVDRLHW